MSRPPGWFVTGTGTGIGKTRLTTALAAALVARGHRVHALKPIETGVDPDPEDAIALATACGRPDLAHARGLIRMRQPLAPLAASLEGEPPVDLDAVVEATRAALQGADYALVEGAGGVLVPIDEHHTMADLAHALGLPVILVARDTLGVLSSVLTAARCLQAGGEDAVGAGPRGIHSRGGRGRSTLPEERGEADAVGAGPRGIHSRGGRGRSTLPGRQVDTVVLARFGPADPSQRTNRDILADLLGVPVHHFTDDPVPVLEALLALNSRGA